MTKPIHAFNENSATLVPTSDGGTTVIRSGGEATLVVNGEGNVDVVYPTNTP